MWQQNQPYGGVAPDGGATRLPTRLQSSSIDVRSKGWIVLVALMVAGLAAGVIIALTSS
jgi:hypothetical protein